MALIEGFPDSPKMSPRISFSHDLSQNDVVLVERCTRSNSSSSAADFDFCVFRDISDQESSSADELFSDGKILPIQIKKKLPPPKYTAAHIPPPQTGSKPCPDSSDGEEKAPPPYKPSFWRIKRSTSLNCGNGYARTLCPLPILSRSNSTGSASGASKRPPFPKQANFSGKYNSLKQASSKPPLKKNSHASYGSTGVKINPILHVPPANLFGLGSIFSGSKKK